MKWEGEKALYSEVRPGRELRGCRREEEEVLLSKRKLQDRDEDVKEEVGGCLASASSLVMAGVLARGQIHLDKTGNSGANCSSKGSKNQNLNSLTIECE